MSTNKILEAIQKKVGVNLGYLDVSNQLNMKSNERIDDDEWLALISVREGASTKNSTLLKKMKKTSKRKRRKIEALRLLTKSIKKNIGNNKNPNLIKASFSQVNNDKNLPKNVAYKIADTIKKTCSIKAIAPRKTLYIYNENEGKYIPYRSDNFGLFLFEKFQNPIEQMKLKSQVIRDIFNFLIYAKELQISLNDFNSAEEFLLNVKNGVLDLKEFKLKPHDPKYMFDYCMPVNFLMEYDKPKKFLAVLEQCFSDKEDRKLLKEIFAYALSNDTSAKKIWFFVGKANTGKSMLLRLLIKIIGEESVTSIPLERLESKFDLDTAVHCRANIVAEVSNLKLKEARNLKMITGGDQVRLEGKFETPYNATLRMKFLLAGNHLPKLDEAILDDDGIKNRFKFIGFYNSLDESERISNYDKILFDEEGDAIFSLLIETLVKLYERNFKFTETENSKQLAEDFGVITKNSIELFVDTYCRQSSNGIISTNELYEMYEEFCEENEFTVQSKKHLLRYIKGLPYHPRKEKKRMNGKKNPVSVLCGIEFSNLD